jgi:hypothetical protein
MKMEGGRNKPLSGAVGAVILSQLFLLDCLNLTAERPRNLLLDIVSVHSIVHMLLTFH